MYDASRGMWVWRTDGRPVTYTNWLTTANMTSIEAFGAWQWPWDEPNDLENEPISLLSATHGAGWLNVMLYDPHRVLCEYEPTD